MREGGGKRERRVLVADRSGSLLRAVARAVDRLAGWQCETAGSIREARDKIVLMKPAVLVIDAELEGEENGKFLQRLVQYYPMPVILVTNQRGAGNGYAGVVMRDADEGRTAAGVARALEEWAGKPVGVVARAASYRIVAIGASTGGTEAIEKVLTTMPENGPGIVIAQHIPRLFSANFAARLNRVTPLEVREAANGDVIRDGLALVAPGDQHMRVALAGDRWQVRLDLGPKVWHQRPAVDILFSTVAQCAAPRAVGVLLTGMGEDGARGLLEMKRAGCWTIAQDAASSVVFGMPRAAIEAGAACEVVSLHRVAAAISAASMVRPARR